MAPFFQGCVSEPLVGMPAFLVAMIGFYGTKSGAFCVGGFRVPAAVVVVAVSQASLPPPGEIASGSSRRTL